MHLIHLLAFRDTVCSMLSMLYCAATPEIWQDMNSISLLLKGALAFKIVMIDFSPCEMNTQNTHRDLLPFLFWLGYLYALEYELAGNVEKTKEGYNHNSGNYKQNHYSQSC